MLYRSPRLIGYARVSTQDQNLDLQIGALTHAGCTTVFTETLSGSSPHKPEFQKLLQSLTPGDTLVVWKLDRMSRSLKQLVDILQLLKDKKCFFKSVTEGIDTSSAFGEMVYNLLGVIAEFERRTIIDRTNAGLQAARSKGKKLGSKFKLTPGEIEELRGYRKDGFTISHIAKRFEIHPTTVYLYLDDRKLYKDPLDEQYLKK